MESAVTDILEEELSTVPGLRTLVSSSGEQFSNITLEFTLDRDVDDAAQDVRDKVSRVRGRLPIDIEEPVIAKQEADASPFFWLALNGQNYSLLQLSDLADRLVKSQLQTVPGVGSVFIAGERRYAMRVWLSTAQLSARGLTVQDVEQAIRTRNVEVPAGRIESNRREFTVRSLGELKTPAEFGELVVASQGGQLVKLKDLGHVELGAEDERSALRFKGAPTVGLGVVRQSKANLITVADAVREALPAHRGVAAARRQHRRARTTGPPSSSARSSRPRRRWSSRRSWSCSSSSCSCATCGPRSSRDSRSRCRSCRRSPSCTSSASPSTTSRCSR